MRTGWDSSERLLMIEHPHDMIERAYLVARMKLPAQPRAAKVPEITALFWVIKILTTGMGEATSDWMGGISIALAAGVGLIGFIVAMWLQFRTPRYVAAIYWFAVMMVAVFGTMTADGPHKVLGIPYAVTTAGYAIVLAAVFTVWHRSEGTLSIHSIVTRRRETFYWLTVLATFALGTAVGDWTAVSLHLGFFSSGVLFGVAILVPLAAWSFFDLNAVAAFWCAYVLTRPLGASFADWLGKPHSKAGGLGYGDGLIAGIATIVIGVLVGYLAFARNDIQPPQEYEPDTATAVRVLPPLPHRD
ncbi:membrane protein [Acidothermaceae bacterium B102]|nr:membrane protein [Acidothermaceae bacterium B102]